MTIVSCNFYMGEWAQSVCLSVLYVCSDIWVALPMFGGCTFKAGSSQLVTHLPPVWYLLLTLPLENQIQCASELKVPLRYEKVRPPTYARGHILAQSFSTPWECCLGTCKPMCCLRAHKPMLQYWRIKLTTSRTPVECSTTEPCLLLFYVILW